MKKTSSQPAKSVCVLTRTTLGLCLFAIVVGSLGCRRDKDAGISSAPPTIAVGTSSKRPAQVHSVLAESALAKSPAAEAQQIDPATVTPERACRNFIARLQTGDLIGAENLLTRTAFTTTKKADLTLEPISGPTAETKVLPARYASHLHRSAEVDCVVSDLIEGQLVDLQMTWQVVRQSSGWRISGMIVPLDGSGKKRLLSFESIDDVATLKVLAAGDVISDVQTLRQAEATETGTTLQ